MIFQCFHNKFLTLSFFLEQCIGFYVVCYELQNKKNCLCFSIWPATIKCNETCSHRSAQIILYCIPYTGCQFSIISIFIVSCFKCLNGEIQIYLRGILQFKDTRRSWFLKRSLLIFHVVHLGIRISGPRLWNSLPQNMWKMQVIIWICSTHSPTGSGCMEFYLVYARESITREFLKTRIFPISGQKEEIVDPFP